MRKVIVALTVMILLVVSIGADIRRTDTNAQSAKAETMKKCYGYTIIEFGKGVDCNGDTINLVKVDGIQRMEKEMTSAE